MHINHIRIGQLFKIVSDPENESLKRVVARNNDETTLYMIDVFDLKAWPIKIAAKKFQIDLERKVFVPIPLEDDPYSFLRQQSEQFRVSDIAVRDRRWDLLQKMLELSPTGELLHSKTRGLIISKVAKESNCSHPILRQILRLYWQRGMSKNALMGGYRNSGAKNQARKMTVKNGKRSKREIVEGRTITPPLTEVDEAIFLWGIKKYYLTRDKKTLKSVFDEILKKHYSQRIYNLETGNFEKLDLFDETKRPSFNQFTYFYNKTRDPVKEKIFREGYKRYCLRYRAVLSDSIIFALGPLSVGQIDATQANLYLVSRILRSSVVGRPTVYILYDVFSHLIVGYVLTFGYPSWHVGAGTFITMFTEKDVLCKKYGVAFNPDEWPHVPGEMFHKIVADGGEFESINADYLINALNTTVTNTSPYRADDTGGVERVLWTIEQECFRFLPGYIHHHTERGDADSRLSACLTLPELNKILTEYIIYYNNYRWMRHYPLSEPMLADEISPFPADIWRWGMKNITGSAPYFPPQEVRRNILPFVNGSITEKGIYFRGIYYTCDAAERRQLFSLARIDGRKPVKMVIDLSDTSQIFVELDKSQPMVLCHPVSRTGNSMFEGWDWGEVSFESDRQDVKFQQNEKHVTEKRLIHQVKQEPIISGAKREHKTAIADMTKAERVRDMRERRKLEYELEKVDGSDIQLQPDADSSPPTPLESDQPYEPPPDYSSEMARNRMRRQSGK
jgi:putative transposase